MRIPVLLRVKGQDSVRESAEVALESGVSVLDARRVEMPPGVELDPSFAAVPIGSGRAAEASLESTAPQRSETFVVRGLIDASDIERFAEPQDGVQAFADPEIDYFQTCGGDPPVGAASDVANKLDVAALGAAGLDGDGVAIVIMDTGINLSHLQQKLGRFPRFDPSNSWTPANATTLPGRYAVGHGTMCAYDALIAAPRATLIDFPILNPNPSIAIWAGRRLSVAVVAYAHLLAMWGIAFAPGGRGRYNALVVSNSWGMFHPSWDFPAGHPGRYADNPDHPFNIIVTTLLRSNADILFAAGNCGSDCPDHRCQNRTSETIMGANALSDTLTIAGCDTNDARVGYSSRGPAIAKMGNTKPDLTAYTHFLGSEAFGVGRADSGTSAACPVAAGCIAALRTQVPTNTTPPGQLFDVLRNSASNAGRGWNGDTGFGIINPVAAGQMLGVVP